MRKDGQRLDEGSAARTSVCAIGPDRESEHGTASRRKYPRCQRVIGMLGKLRVSDRFDPWMITQEGDDAARVLDMAGHPQRQRLDPLQDVKCRGGRHAGTEIAQTFPSSTKKKCGGRRLLGEDHVVESAVG